MSLVSGLLENDRPSSPLNAEEGSAKNPQRQNASRFLKPTLFTVFSKPKAQQDLHPKALDYSLVQTPDTFVTQCLLWRTSRTTKQHLGTPSQDLH